FISQTTTWPVVVLCQRMSLAPSPLKSPVIRICQGLNADPGEPPPITVVPFKNQISTSPVNWLIQRMSVLPPPLKSPVPMASQARGAEPGEPPPMTLAPSISQNTTSRVGLFSKMRGPLPAPSPSAGRGTNPVLTGGSDPGKPPPMTFGPFISQTTTWPVVVLCQRMSPLPSPLKSPVP